MSATDKTFDWIKDGACAEQPEPFDLYDKDPEMAKIADDLCIGCPVIRQCFVKGHSNEWGQWGGIYWDGQGRADAKANSHKTEEYLERVKSLVTKS